MKDYDNKLSLVVGNLLLDNQKKKAARLLWPWLVQNEQSDRIWKALDQYPYLAIMGHASASKTFTCAAWFLLDWWQAPSETALIITSDTIASMNRRIWSDIKLLLTKTKTPMPGILVDSKRIIQHSPMDQKNAIAGVAAESDDAQSKIQGIHTKRVRVLVDEADNKLSKSIWGALSNLGASGDMKVVALANPVDRLGEFGMHCEPTNGWGSINPELDDEWNSRLGWHVLRLDGIKSPNIVAKKDIFPFLLTNKGVEDIRTQKGELSPEWWSYVRAWYPPSGSIQSIFTNEIIELSRNRIDWHAGTTPIGACDPALEGGDNCSLVLGRMGRLAKDPNKTAVEANAWITIKRKNTAVPVTHDYGEQIYAHLINAGIKPENFACDCTGNARGISDHIQFLFKEKTLALEFGAKPTDMFVTTEDTTRASDRFDRFVSELWYVSREWMKFGLVSILNPPRSLSVQLEGRLYKLVNRKIRIETKDEMKERNICSPDEGDALMMLVFLARSRSKTGTPGLAQQGKKFDPLKRFKRIQNTYEVNYGIKTPKE